MKKSEIKSELLKMLRDEMMSDEKDEMMEGMLPEKKIKATIVADDEEGIVEGAKKIPEAMSKAQKFMKARLEDKK
jgi:hypothetical protein